MALGWQAVEMNHNPGPRSRHGLVYDSAEESIVLFGGVDWGTGECQSDTWILKRSKWKKVRSDQTPPCRHRGAMVFDSERGFTVLFGGQTQDRTGWPMLNDTWTWQDGSWWLQPHRGWFWKSPAHRCGHAMAFDEELGATVLFGGINVHDQPLGDTWIYDGATWSQVKGEGPPARRYASFAFHPELKGCLLHGGAVDDNGRQKFGDTWLFRDSKWTSMGENFDTDARDDHAMAFDHSSGRMLMLEGLLRDHQGSVKREVLMLSSGGWRTIKVNPLHPRLQCSPLAYAPKLGGLVMYGGETGHGGDQFEETLVLRSDSYPSG